MDTTLADLATCTLGIGYTGGLTLVFALLLASLGIWYKTMGSVSVSSLNSPKAEMFYWVTMMFSQTLGTALGPWTADTAALGDLGAAIIFGRVLVVIVTAHYFTNLSKNFLFWAAFIVTRPLGAFVGGFLVKPVSAGGPALSRYKRIRIAFIVIVACFLLFPQRAGESIH